MVPTQLQVSSASDELNRKLSFLHVSDDGLTQVQKLGIILEVSWVRFYRAKLLWPKQTLHTCMLYIVTHARMETQKCRVASFGSFSNQGKEKRVAVLLSFPNGNSSGSQKINVRLLTQLLFWVLAWICQCGFGEGLCFVCMCEYLLTASCLSPLSFLSLPLSCDPHSCHFQTRLGDWKEGFLTSKYMLVKLKEMEDMLQEYIESAIPTGWVCSWDRWDQSLMTAP